MLTKEDILDNVESYTSEELADYIKSNLVTLDELKMTGSLPPTRRREIEDLVKNSEDDDWRKAQQANTVEAYQQYLDTYQSGKYRNEARNKKSELQSEAQVADAESEWESVNKDSLHELKQYRDSHPSDDPHMSECKKLIFNLQASSYAGPGIVVLSNKIREIDTASANQIFNKPAAKAKAIKEALSSGRVSKRDILNEIQKDHNWLDHTTLYQLMVDDQLIDFDDLNSIGIDSRFFSCLCSTDNNIQTFNAKALTEIDLPCTEVYFWGIPSSGKTCALGGILSVANSGHVARTMAMDKNCQGYAYMNSLANLFKSDKATNLPPSTGFTQTYAMSFDLVDQKGKTHPITLIDLAGELFKAMYWHDADPTKLTDEQSKHLETVTNILKNNRSNNRKIHFFVIEYGAENRLYDGFPQNVYLNGALQYIDGTGILDKDTDGIYVLLSKSDKAERDGLNSLDDIKEYIGKGYANFYNGLVNLCQKYEINGGHVDIIPFTLGEVCFKDFCLFDDYDSSEVVNLILERSYTLDTGKIGKLKNIFRS